MGLTRYVDNICERAFLAERSCSPALISYDYLLTMDDELALVWRLRMSPSWCIYLLNRVTQVVLAVDTAIIYANPTVRVTLLQLIVRSY